jgi:hypothetical protein
LQSLLRCLLLGSLLPSSPISHVKTFQNQKRCIAPLMLILALNMAQGSSRSRARICALRSAGALVSKLEAHGANSLVLSRSAITPVHSSLGYVTNDVFKWSVSCGYPSYLPYKPRKPIG